MKKLTAALTIALGLTLLQQPTFADNSNPNSRSQFEQTNKEDGSPSESVGSRSQYGGHTHFDSHGKADGTYFPIIGASIQPASGSGNIIYHGGPVLQTVNLYKIYYGNWSNPCASFDTSTAGVLNNFLNTVGSSSWYKTTTSYYSVAGSAKSFVSNTVNNTGCISVPSSTLGTSFDAATGNQISTIVQNQITAQSWPANSNDLYFVFTSPDISVSGFKTSMCGYHTYTNSGANTVQYSFVGDSGNSASCVSSSILSASPNANPTADGMASVVAHELVETVSDPRLNAWFDNGGNENGDKCGWIFGNSFTVNGGKANSTAGTGNYYLQENVAANTNSCVSVLPSKLSTVASVSPMTGPSATSIVITGTNLSASPSTNYVYFNGTLAKISSQSATSITVTVPTGATTGPITVVSDYGVWVSPTNFTVAALPVPAILSISPASGRIGTPISINGSNFTGATAVKIGTVSITGFTVASDSLITATIPTTAKTGNITVAGPGGTSTGVSFTVAAPVVSSFTPSNSLASTAITITGSNFTGATGAKIGTVALTGFSVVNDTQINATIPTSATTATISVTSAAGTGTSIGLFVKGLPTITSFTPASITISSATNSVTITGTNLLSSTSVTLTPTVGTPVVISGLTGISATKATFLCPKTLPLTTYKIQITTPAGTSAQAASSLTIK